LDLSGAILKRGKIRMNLWLVIDFDFIRRVPRHREIYSSGNAAVTLEKVDLNAGILSKWGNLQRNLCQNPGNPMHLPCALRRFKLLTLDNVHC
jgi:hypothetical protein